MSCKASGKDCLLIINPFWGKDVLAKIVLPCDHQAILSYRNLEGFLPSCPFGMGKNKLVAHSSIC
ncbi:hypothetical protein V9654_001785 [Vibrio parahaemolyticus]|uniref:hypothetical protein n=1 Tax=Vibrio parahaemolyticus TaxID=670 RepID=UPI0006B2784F|nr:hypothetical protein [Vibrio parahaemolyticus]EGR1221637.1 hypothetical protein [Vibrio parahaemolyticus]EGR1549786.1 hypothetical protein [Vibrio parahaemolyticus]EGR2220139.1 hypothetical protein [Vibrio parahaemolyticus]EGR2781520.1 hypothetical protein [Vibrio parahaemolyticus]EHU4841204.1 hypothetical protein [Vibrio parahaemolyticus]